MPKRKTIIDEFFQKETDSNRSISLLGPDPNRSDSGRRTVLVNRSNDRFPNAATTNAGITESNNTLDTIENTYSLQEVSNSNRSTSLLGPDPNRSDSGRRTVFESTNASISGSHSNSIDNRLHGAQSDDREQFETAMVENEDGDRIPSRGQSHTKRAVAAANISPFFQPKKKKKTNADSITTTSTTTTKTTIPIAISESGSGSDQEFLEDSQHPHAASKTEKSHTKRAGAKSQANHSSFFQPRKKKKEIADSVTTTSTTKTTTTSSVTTTAAATIPIAISGSQANLPSSSRPKKRNIDATITITPTVTPKSQANHSSFFRPRKKKKIADAAPPPTNKIPDDEILPEGESVGTNLYTRGTRRVRNAPVQNVTIPEKRSKKDAVAMVGKLLHVDDIIADEKPTEEEVIRLNHVVALNEEYVSEQWDKANWEPTELVDDTPGLYGIEYKSKPEEPKDESKPKGPKVGQSGRRIGRTNICSGKNDKKYSLDGQEKCNRSVEDYRVTKMMQLARPPGLNFHPDQYPRLSNLAKRLYRETMYASCFKTRTKKCGERFVQLPSKELRSIFYPTDNIVTNEIREFFQGMTGVFNILAWPPIRSDLEALALISPFLNKKLSKPPQHKFVTNYLNAMLWGSLKLGWENAVQISPRFNQIQDLVRKIEPCLSGKDQLDDSKIIELISRIDEPGSKNRANQIQELLREMEPCLSVSDQDNIDKDKIIELISGIDEPGSKDRANQIQELLREMEPCLSVSDQDNIDKDKIIELISGIDEPDSEKYKSYVPATPEDNASGTKRILLRLTALKDTSVFITMEMDAWKAIWKYHESWCNSFFQPRIIPVEDHSLLVRCSTTDHKVVVHMSYFTAMDEKSTFKVRINATKAMFDMKRLQGGVGLIRQEEVDQTRDWLLSFAMGLDSVASNGKGSYREARLNHMPDGFFPHPLPNIMNVSKHIGKGIGYCECLSIYLLLGREKFNRMVGVFKLKAPTPLDLNFRCPGGPGWVCDNDDPNPEISMVGAKTPGHPFYGQFNCQKCVNKFRSRIIPALQEKHHLSPDETRLLGWKSQQMASNAKEQANYKRGNLPKVLKSERHQNHQRIGTRKPAAPSNDTAKRSGTNHAVSKPKKKYPTKLRKMMKQSIYLYLRIKVAISESNDIHAFKSHMISLLSLVRIGSGLDKNPPNKNNEDKYWKEEYTRCIYALLEPGSNANTKALLLREEVKDKIQPIGNDIIERINARHTNDTDLIPKVAELVLDNNLAQQEKQEADEIPFGEDTIDPVLAEYLKLNDTFEMKSHHFTTLLHVHDKWYGKGAYVDEMGGAHGRIKLFDKRCVKANKENVSKKAFDCSISIIKMLESRAKNENIPVEDIIEEMEPDFVDCNQSLQKFIDKCKDLGYIKSRTKKVA